MVKIEIIDQVNCHISGLPNPLYLKLKKFLSYPVPGAFQTVAYQLKYWDGREPLIEDGFTFNYLLDDIGEFLENHGYNFEDIDYIDNRSCDIPFDEICPITDTFLIQETGKKLRDLQVDLINSAIIERKGIFDAATNAGKSLVVLGICKVFDPYIKTVTIVPTSYLANQLEKDFKGSSLSFCKLDSSVKIKNREKAIKNHQHIIITSKLFLNCVEYFKDSEYAILYDEVHKLGDVMFDKLRFDMNHCPVRFGLTGTVPKDKLKRMKTFSVIGAGPLKKVSVNELIKKGYASKFEVKLYATEHPSFYKEFHGTDEFGRFKDDLVWDIEDGYLNSNKDRLNVVFDFIKSLPPKNTLILSRPDVAKFIAKGLGVEYITQDTSEEKRRELFSKFPVNDDFVLPASFETASTGISVNEIYRLILIDVGKNETYFMQGIGRALRLDGVINEAEVIDIYSNTKYSIRHKNDRVKAYRREKFEFEEIKEFLFVA